jgi:glycine hydroxymethyltransferase
MVPGDERSPMQTSGLRLGTAALTTCGMREAEMGAVARMIVDVIHQPTEVETVRKAVYDLASSFPQPGYPPHKT